FSARCARKPPLSFIHPDIIKAMLAAGSARKSVILIFCSLRSQTARGRSTLTDFRVDAGSRFGAQVGDLNFLLAASQTARGRSTLTDFRVDAGSRLGAQVGLAGKNSK